MNRSSGVEEISKALYRIFKDKIDNEDHVLMHEDNYIKKEVKKIVGKKKYEEIETFDRKVWIESWQEFDIMIKIDKELNNKGVDNFER